jgi:adenine phosphoribosyltransferase
MADISSALSTEDLRRAVQAAVRVVPDFPFPGVSFRDISATWEQQSHLYRLLVDEIARPYLASPPDVVLAIESLGYLFGAPVAYVLRCRLVLARPPGKLAGGTLRTPYAMSYAAGKHLEIHAEAIKPNDRVLVVDDVLASGGTIAAALELVERAGALCVGVGCAVEVSYPGTRSRLRRGDLRIHAVVQV